MPTVASWDFTMTNINSKSAGGKEIWGQVLIHLQLRSFEISCLRIPASVQNEIDEIMILIPESVVSTMRPIVKVIVIVRPLVNLNQSSSLQNQGLSTKWWYFPAVLLAASSDNPRHYARGCKLRFHNDKYQFKVSWCKWNLRPSSYPCSGKILWNLLPTNSNFRPKCKRLNYDLKSRVGGSITRP